MCCIYLLLIWGLVGQLQERSKVKFCREKQDSFVVDGQNFYVNGWNSYWFMDHAVSEYSRPRIREMLQAGAKMGLTVCRTWAFNDGDYNALQLSPGKYDEKVFKALDHVIAEARQHGIRLLLCLVNNLQAYGGKTQYVKWAWDEGVGLSSSNDSFFFDPSIRHYFKNYVKTLLTRKNTITGIEYRDDPTIFGWELINEPRCVSDASGDTLQHNEDVRREVQIIHHLTGHRNIVELKGAFEDRHSVNLIMELCAGGELFDRIIAKGHFSERAAAVLCRQMVTVVHNRHSTGVLHRDLEQNFLLLNTDEDSPLKATALDWIEEMSMFVKSVDKKHLLTVGVEGFYGPKSPKKFSYNPEYWAADLGSDFIRNSMISTVDFASVHIYPDHWFKKKDLAEKLRFVSKWMHSHIEDGEKELMKPVMFTEYGLSDQIKGFNPSQRDDYYKTVFDIIYESAKKNGAGAGSFAWQFFVEGMQEYNDEFGIVPWESPTTYKLIMEQSCRLARLHGAISTQKEHLNKLCSQR